MVIVLIRYSVKYFMKCNSSIKLQVNGYTCDCEPGYTGDLCEEDINECLGVTCQNGGTCLNLVNSYQCVCVDGYIGITCEVNINDCEESLCQNGATCHDLVNGFR